MDRQPQQQETAEQALPEAAVPAALPLAFGPGPLDVLALQRSAGNAAIARAAAADDGSLQQALARVARVRSPEPPKPRISPARLLRAKLARAVTTSGGDWDTEQYELKQDDDGSGNAVDPAVGVRGLDIKLKFSPNASVDAELLGLTQSVQGFIGGAPSLTPSAATRAIPSADAQPLNTGPGETDEGTAIDRAGAYNNPIYGVATTPSAGLTDTNYRPGIAQEGFNYTDAAGTAQKKDAKLYDTPRRSGAAKDARHIFETTALATKGTQAGTYYGSVRWGWRTDAAGNHTKIDLAVISEGVPSSTFMKAAEIWNKGKSSAGAANVQLPTVDVKVTTGPVTLKPPVPMVDIALLPGTRLQVITEWVAPLLAGTVKVVDGPHTNVTGEVDAAEWGNIADERS